MKAPNVNIAYENAVINSNPNHFPKTWLHAAVVDAAIKTNTCNLWKGSKRDIWPLFAKHYQESCDFYDLKNSVKQPQTFRQEDEPINPKSGTIAACRAELMKKYEEFNSRDKAMPVIMKLMENMGDRITSKR